MFSINLAGHVVESMHVTVANVDEVQTLQLGVPHGALSVHEQGRAAGVLM